MTLPDSAADGYEWYNAQTDLHNHGFYDLSRADLYRRVELVILEHQPADPTKASYCRACGQDHPCPTYNLLCTGEPQ